MIIVFVAIYMLGERC